MGSGFKTGGSPALRSQTIELHRAERKRVSWPVFLFLIGLVVPWVIAIGPLRLSIYRCVLLVMVLPCLGMWLAGKAGRIRTADIVLLLFWSWCALSLIVLHGMAPSVEPIGIAFVETVGAYLLARCYVRDADDFYNTIQLLFRIVVVLLPFALFEFVTGHNILRDLFATIWPTWSAPPEPGRWGFSRVQTVFDHPILFGVFAGSIFALVHLVLGYQKRFVQRALKTGVVGLTSFLSLSAGPILVVVVQGLLLAWNSLLRTVKVRWGILIGIVMLFVLMVELVANRSLPAIVASYIAFDDQSYWFRVLIWEYGSASALNHPLLGVGLNDWPRPEWMPPSIDNVWLFYAVRNGLPAAFLILLTFILIVLRVGLRKGLDDRLREYRTGFLITMMAFFVVGWTVHFWDAAYVLFLFLMGSGVWILDAGTEQTTVLHARGVPRPGSGLPGRSNSMSPPGRALHRTAKSS